MSPGFGLECGLRVYAVKGRLLASTRRSSFSPRPHASKPRPVTPGKMNQAPPKIIRILILGNNVSWHFGSSVHLHLSDGGDIRALSQMEVLKAIMYRVQWDMKLTNEILPCRHFQLIAGVGPGGYATPAQSAFERLMRSSASSPPFWAYSRCRSKKLKMNSSSCTNSCSIRILMIGQQGL